MSDFGKFITSLRSSLNITTLAPRCCLNAKPGLFDPKLRSEKISKPNPNSDLIFFAPAIPSVCNANLSPLNSLGPNGSFSMMRPPIHGMPAQIMSNMIPTSSSSAPNFLQMEDAPPLPPTPAAAFAAYQGFFKFLFFKKILRWRIKRYEGRK